MAPLPAHTIKKILLEPTEATHNVAWFGSPVPKCWWSWYKCCWTTRTDPVGILFYTVNTWRETHKGETTQYKVHTRRTSTEVVDQWWFLSCHWFNSLCSKVKMLELGMPLPNYAHQILIHLRLTSGASKSSGILLCFVSSKIHEQNSLHLKPFNWDTYWDCKDLVRTSSRVESKESQIFFIQLKEKKRKREKGERKMQLQGKEN